MHDSERVQMYLTAPDGATSAECTADMLDSQGALTDTRQVLFSVNATVTDSLSVSDGTRESLTGGDRNARNCGCSSFFSLLCFFRFGCTGSMMKAIGTILTMLATGAHSLHGCKFTPVYR